MSNCCLTQIPKFYALMLTLFLVARPQKILTVTLKWANIFRFLQIFSGKNDCFLDRLKAKTKEKHEKYLFNTIYVKNKFSHFWKYIECFTTSIFKFCFCHCSFMLNYSTLVYTVQYKVFIWTLLSNLNSFVSLTHYFLF